VAVGHRSQMATGSGKTAANAAIRWTSRAQSGLDRSPFRPARHLCGSAKTGKHRTLRQIPQVHTRTSMYPETGTLRRRLYQSALERFAIHGVAVRDIRRFFEDAGDGAVLAQAELNGTMHPRGIHIALQIEMDFDCFID